MKNESDCGLWRYTIENNLEYLCNTKTEGLNTGEGEFKYLHTVRRGALEQIFNPEFDYSGSRLRYCITHQHVVYLTSKIKP